MTDRSSPASVRQRLFNRARERNEDFHYVLTRYAIERLLYRLSRSDYRDRFVLKGAILFELWTATPHRATRDVDLLGTGDATIPHLEDVFRAVCSVDVEPDGITFDPETVRGTPIREEDEYQGVRIHVVAVLALARITVQVDIGFGDAVTPEAREEQLPTLLEFAPPVLKAYPPETVIAEKFEAMVRLGIANSRLKDFYDLAVLARTRHFPGPTLSAAIGATFRRRGTTIPTEAPIALSREFATDRGKQRQWSAFTAKTGKVASEESLDVIVSELAAFLMPPAIAAGTDEAFAASWSPGEGWD